MKISFHVDDDYVRHCQAVQSDFSIKFLIIFLSTLQALGVKYHQFVIVRMVDLHDGSVDSSGAAAGASAESATKEVVQERGLSRTLWSKNTYHQDPLLASRKDLSGHQQSTWTLQADSRVTKVRFYWCSCCVFLHHSGYVASK